MKNFSYFLTLTLAWIESYINDSITKYETQVLRQQSLVSVIHHGTEIFVTDGRFIYVNNYPSSVTRKRQNQIFRALSLPLSSYQKDWVTYLSVSTYKSNSQYFIIDTHERVTKVYESDKITHFGSELIIQLRQELMTAEQAGFKVSE